MRAMAMSTALEAQSSSIVVRRGWIAGAGVAATMSSPAKRPRDDAIDTTPTGAITLSGSDGVESPSEAKKRRATTTESDRRHASQTTADTTQQSRNGSVDAQTGLYVMRFIAYPDGVVSQFRCGCRGQRCYSCCVGGLCWRPLKCRLHCCGADVTIPCRHGQHGRVHEQHA